MRRKKLTDAAQSKALKHCTAMTKIGVPPELLLDAVAWIMGIEEPAPIATTGELEVVPKPSEGEAQA